MEEKLFYVAVGVVGWLGAVVVTHLYTTSRGKSKKVIRCSNIVKQEVKNIRRYSKSINDSCK